MHFRRKEFGYDMLYLLILSLTDFAIAVSEVSTTAEVTVALAGVDSAIVLSLVGIPSAALDFTDDRAVSCGKCLAKLSKKVQFSPRKDECT
jgi:hypothetical protein